MWWTPRLRRQRFRRNERRRAYRLYSTRFCRSTTCGLRLGSHLPTGKVAQSRSTFTVGISRTSGRTVSLGSTRGFTGGHHACAVVWTWGWSIRIIEWLPRKRPHKKDDRPDWESGRSKGWAKRESENSLTWERRLRKHGWGTKEQTPYSAATRVSVLAGLGLQWIALTFVL